ncbi:MAG: hypothetical protein M3O34_18940 [Chloroflexota bacterium]|nr:hypothetical protein [Chloroflexota bacterium]
MNALLCRRAAVRALVLSEHDAVRRQLVAYLGRSSGLEVTGEPFRVAAIREARPQVLVLDLSGLGRDDLGRAITAAAEVGARVIALASVHEPTAEREVVEAGGTYRLKTVGADGLAEIVTTTGQPVA